MNESGMKCPQCGQLESQVLESRHHLNHIRRRRVCRVCEHRYTTHERVVLEPIKQRRKKCK